MPIGVYLGSQLSFLRLAAVCWGSGGGGLRDGVGGGHGLPFGSQESGTAYLLEISYYHFML